MLSLFSIILGLLATFYILILGTLIIGLYRLGQGNSPNQPFVTVVIAARNEEANIGSCLQSMDLQNYPREKHEIIIVDDRSEDDTAAIALRFVETDSRFRLLNVKELNPGMAPKKWALHQGIEQARGEIVMVTDADCIVKPGWIASMVRFFEDRIGLVAGFSPLNRSFSGSLFHRLITLDGLALAGVAAGSFGAGFPLTCNGRNLAYRKSAYEEAGGFRSIGRFISGDDDLFLHQVREKTQWKMAYCIDRESIVSSNPPARFIDFFHQRTRHASKGRHYPWVLTIGLIVTYLFNLMLLIALFFPGLWFLFVILFGGKSLFEFLLVSKTARLFEQKQVLPLFPIGMLIHVFYVVFFGFWGQVGRFRWKDEKFTSTIK